MQRVDQEDWEEISQSSKDGLGAQTSQERSASSEMNNRVPREEITVGK